MWQEKIGQMCHHNLQWSDYPQVPFLLEMLLLWADFTRQLQTFCPLLPTVGRKMIIEPPPSDETEFLSNCLEEDDIDVGIKVLLDCASIAFVLFKYHYRHQNNWLFTMTREAG